ncbi:LysR family transcriptional regulator [Noviherbaspirillum saxi]|uniref:LysR family transcriptional regulator n=1 Tax=Noviherbaspirillum saxi TaxID=2320863 RepID=A0A3A3FKG0_9BURK|nr:LysR family transcriptional regulator [Noviherbaspirillum saxi]RJF95674.1 LysR family transcriptional regulator [Noviherbaspirillum saxi]
MRFNKLDLNLLVALDVLLSEQSITRAARKLNLSQSATSGVLARLREYFKDDLLIQVGRIMVRTVLAEQLSNPVRDVLLQIQSTIETKPGFDPARSTRHFRIAASDYSTCVILSRLVRRLGDDAPGISLEIISPRDDTVEQAERGEIDIVLMPRAFTGMEAHSGELLLRDVYCCIVWEGNTLVDYAITMQQYLAMDHVAARFGDRASSFEEWTLHGAGIERRIATTSTHFSILPQLLIGTNRVATLQSRLAALSARYFPIRILQAPMAIPPMEMMMRWHRFLDGDLAHHWLREQLKSAAASGSDSEEEGDAVHAAT